MRNVIIKRGGKVEGIRGLYKDPRSGRWYVRLCYKNLDTQKSLDFGTKTPSFSILEREAARALKALRKEIDERTVSGNVDKQTVSSPSVKLSPVELGQKALSVYLNNVYKHSNISEVIFKKREKQLNGFALIPQKDIDHAQEIAAHNRQLLDERYSEIRARGVLISSVRYYDAVKAFYNKAIKDGYHFGVNPCSGFNVDHDKSPKDRRQISADDSARMQAELPEWCAKHAFSETKTKELFCFHYLCTLGMRPSSAMVFKQEDLKKDDHGVWRYRVYNCKARTGMPITQIIHPAFAQFLKNNLSAFTYCEKGLLADLNKFYHEKLGDLCMKHLRKGFISEILSSKEFSETDVKRITHLINDMADNRYYCRDQEGSDAVCEWWNSHWYEGFEIYINTCTEYNSDILNFFR